MKLESPLGVIAIFQGEALQVIRVGVELFFLWKGQKHRNVAGIPGIKENPVLMQDLFAEWGGG